MLGSSETVDTFSCLQCSHQTASALQLDHHIQRRHRHDYGTELFHAIDEPEQLSCHICHYNTDWRVEIYKHHKQRVHVVAPKDEQNGQYSCRQDTCTYETNSILSLLKHDASSCKQLKRRSTMPENNASMFTRIDGKLKCNVCSFRAKYKSQMERHALIHADDEEIDWLPCRHCPYRAKRKPDLKRHVLTKHATGAEIVWFECNHCSYRAKQKSHLKLHLVHTHARPEDIDWFRCERCAYRAKTKARLKEHVVLTHATNDQIEWFQCDRCSYRAKRKPALKTHVSLQHDIKWLQCNSCAYRAKEKASLKSHMLTHAADDEIDWFRCAECSYRAKHKSSWKAHMLKHADEATATGGSGATDALVPSSTEV